MADRQDCKTPSDLVQGLTHASHSCESCSVLMKNPIVTLKYFEELNKSQIKTIISFVKASSTLLQFCDLIKKENVYF